MIGTTLIVGFLYAVIFGGAGYWLRNHVRAKASALPANHLERLTNDDLLTDTKRMVCFGDSLTLGTCSFDYVSELNRLLIKQSKNRTSLSDSLTDENTKANQPWLVINAGLNSDLSWNLLQRIGPVIKCNPDFVVILIGTNDINATLSEDNLNGYRAVKNIRHQPELPEYEANIRALVSRLKSETDARIALVSPPLFGETASDSVNILADRYAEVLDRVCRESGVGYLPFREAHKSLIFAEYGAGNPDSAGDGGPGAPQAKENAEMGNGGYFSNRASGGGTCRIGEIAGESKNRVEGGSSDAKPVSKPAGYDYGKVRRQVTISPWYRFVLNAGWNSIGRWNGYKTLADGIHLNENSGKLLAGMIHNWLNTGSLKI